MSDLSLWLPIVAGFIAVAYGVITTQRLMALPTGSAKMQEIAKAIQEGANAYLNRQYRTIAMIGVRRRGRSSRSSSGTGRPLSASCIGAVLSGAAGYHRHENLGAGQRPHH